MKIFTIGYEGLDVSEFMLLLSRHSIETVVDIRELPLSRKRGFSKTALSDLLGQAGIAYVHTVDLGCPKAVRNQYRVDGDWARYTQGFLKHLKAQGAALIELCARARITRCALLCFEADFNYCHRSMVADAVRERCGAHIEHITAREIRTSRPARRLAVPA